MVPLSLTSEELALLGRCPLLRGCPEELLLRIVQSKGARLTQFATGQTVYSPTSFLHCLGIVLSGCLQVHKGTLAVSELEAGALFGAAALYSDAPNFVTTITARRATRSLLLEHGLMDRLLADNPRIRENYLRYLTGRIRFLSGRLQSLAQSGAEGKLAQYLLAHGQNGSVTCSATELANRLSISRASLYRAFATLEESGLIQRAGKTIIIPSLTTLEGVL